ncbi:hypothetical protein ACGF13_08960 [Kitasatospora sp. NPDC048286]|uniref:hypothetical protein n=1 Tax=Kitasatospora sp. NPDC048286 TaxID=3364047 RepID=UPI00371DC5E4
MATTNWESVLLVFASSDRTQFTQRSAVSGDDKVQWIAGHKYETLNYFKQTGGNEGYDCWWSYNYTDSSGHPWSHVIGCNLNWKQFTDETTELGKWIRQGYDVLMPLAHSPYENDVMSPWSFDTAVSTLTGARQLLQTWAPTVRGWAGDINAPGADWQGTAAGVFKTMLSQFGDKVEGLAKALADKHVDTLLKTGRDATQQAIGTMWNGQETYRNSRNAWPVNPLLDALLEGMSTAKVTVSEGLITTSDGSAVAGTDVSFSVMTAWGDPHGDDFWKKAEKRAKEVWLKNVADILDKAAADAVRILDAAYVPAIQGLGDGIHVKTPKAPYRAPQDDPLGGNSDPYTELSKNLSDMNKNMNDSLTDMNKGMSDNFKGMSDNFKNLTSGPGSGPSIGPGSGPGPVTGGPGGIGGGSSGLPGGGSSGLPGIGGGGSGFPSGGGSGVPVLDQNGKQVFDSHGNPVTVPPGSHIDPTTHQVIGPDGKPVLGPDGKPITVPDGATVGTGPGDHMKVPPGSHVDDKGRVIGPDGQPVLDRNGNPIVVEPGSRIDADGTLLDPDGRPVSEVTQLLADQRHAFENGFGGGGGDGLLGGGGFGSGSYSYHPGSTSFGGSGDSDGLGGYSGTGLMPGGRSGLSAKALANGGDPNTAQARAATEAAEAAEKAAAARAAAEAEKNALTGKGMSTSGGMPPMMPPGAGAGAAPNQKDKDRQRTTWLAEDEEVWGTESTAVAGVIGR